VTAVLLLLSLPVLAGGPFNIAPALNLAVCGDTSHLELCDHPALVALMGTVYLGDNPQVTRPDYNPRRNLNDCAPGPFRSIASCFPSYFCGLIEGDGTIVVPRVERAPSGKLTYASVQISFPTKDYPLAAAIMALVGHGSLAKKKKVAAYVYTVNNLEGLIKLANLLNGKFRTSKILDFQSLVAYLNRKSPGLNLVAAPLDSSSLDSNS